MNYESDDESQEVYVDVKYENYLIGLIKEKLLKNKNHIKEEVEFIKESILDCLRYILDKNILRNPNEFNGGKIYRTGLLRDVDKSFIPLGKAISKNCGVEDKNEAVWFSTSNLYHYMEARIKKINEEGGEKVYGIQTCKVLNNNKSLYFINLSSDETKKCDGYTSYVLNKELQFLFNKCLIIPLIRNYSSLYDSGLKINYKSDAIFKNTTIKINKHVPGYPCEGKKTQSTSVKNIFEAWDYSTGTRNSFFNEDRIQITLLFQLIDIFNHIFEYKNEKKTILGWTCENTPTIKNKLFHSELAIAIKFLQEPLREHIFEKDNETCSVSIIEPNSSTAGGIGTNKRTRKDESDKNTKRRKLYLENDDVPDIVDDDIVMNMTDVPNMTESLHSSRTNSDTHIVPDDLDNQLNNYTKDPTFPDTVPDIDDKIEDVNEFLFNLKKIREEVSIELAGGRKRTKKRKMKSTHKSTRKHRKRKMKSTRKQVKRVYK